MPGAACRSSARRGGSTTAEMPSGAPIVNLRVDVAGSNGSAVETTRLTLARISATGSASSMPRAVGTTPFGVLRNSGSLRSCLSLPRPWLTAEAERFSRAAARPTWRSCAHDLEQNQKVEVGAREINFLQHIAEIISLDSARRNCDQPAGGCSKELLRLNPNPDRSNPPCQTQGLLLSARQPVPALKERSQHSSSARLLRTRR